MAANGYAVTDPRGDILVKTVSEHERGAIVNWLYCYAGVLVMDDMTNEEIYDDWREHKGNHQVIPVTIMRGHSSEHG